MRFPLQTIVKPSPHHIVPGLAFTAVGSKLISEFGFLFWKAEIVVETHLKTSRLEGLHVCTRCM